MKIMTPEDVVAELQDGMTIGIGGWGSRRKPMTLVKALARSPLKDLHIVSYGGPDVGLLCAVGKVRKLTFGFVSLDSIPLEPHFRKAREQRLIQEVVELDEGLLQLGLRAAAWGLPFLPSRAGLGTVVETSNPHLKTVECPYTGQRLLAMPALRLDAALIHLNRVSLEGTGQVLGPDPYFDDWFCRAARRAYVSAEALTLDPGAPLQTLLVDRTMIHGVVEAPGGAWFTECPPDYPRDEALQARYAAAAQSREALDSFLREALGGAA